MYRDTMRDFWRGHAGVARVRLALHRLERPLRVRRAPPVGLDQLRHRARRLHARRPRRLQPQAQRGERRGQPRRHRRQPLVELRRRGADRRSRDPRAARAPAAQLPRHAAALAGRADADRGRRARAHARAATTTRGARTTRSPGSTGSSTRRVRSCRPSRAACSRCGASTRSSTARTSSSGAASDSGLPDAWWFRPDGRRMTAADWQNGAAHALGVFLNGQAMGSFDAQGEPIADDSFLLLLNAHHEDIAFTLPPRRFGPRWTVELSTADPRAPAVDPDGARVGPRDRTLAAPAAPAAGRLSVGACGWTHERVGPVPSRLNREEDLVADTTVVLVGTLDTKGARVRVPARPPARGRRGGGARRRGHHGAAARRARRHARGGRRRGGRQRRGAARRRRPRPGRARDGRAAPTAIVARLHDEGRCDGVLARGRLGQHRRSPPQAMRALPVGVPKLIVSTIAAGDTRRYVGASDMTAAGLGRRRRGHQLDLARASSPTPPAAMAGMVQAPPVELGEAGR